MDRTEVDALEHLAPVALEAAGQIANPDAEQQPGVQGSAGRDEPPGPAPVHRAAALDVARAEREVGAGLALGSRYVQGGGTVNWGRTRRLVSTGGSLYARLLLGVRVRDLTGGFKCYRREVLERIDLGAIHSKGYAFQIETTYRALRAGFTVVEVPITFADRTAGHSKMSRAIFLEAVAKVPLLRLAALTGRL